MTDEKRREVLDRAAALMKEQREATRGMALEEKVLYLKALCAGFGAVLERFEEQLAEGK
jgi:hypothetical protein